MAESTQAKPKTTSPSESASASKPTPAKKADSKFTQQSKEQARSDGLGDTKIQQGFMDQKSARLDSEAWEGHFVTIDLTDKDVQAAYKETQGLDGHTGNYGVFTQCVAADPDTGRCTVALVRLRDDTNALVRVPYDALTPSSPGGRR